MVKEGTFGPTEAIILLTMSNAARIFLPYPRFLAETGGPAAWMTPLGGLVVALIGVHVATLVLRKDLDKTIIEITEEALGPVLGMVFNLITFAFFMAVATLFIREFSEAMIIAALPSTPISVIAFTFLFAGLLGAYLGIETMARSARLMYPYAIGGIIILLLALIPRWDVYNIFPILGNGALRVFGEGTFSTSAVTEIILAAVLVQAMGGVEKFRHIGFRSMIIAFALLMALLVTLTMALSWEVVTENTLPFYRLSSIIYLSRFFQRVEAVFVIIWGIIGALKIALTLYGASVSLARTLKLPDYRPLIWPLGLSVYILSFLPPDMPTAVKLDADFLRPFALIPNYLLPLLVFVAFWLRRGGKNAG